MILAHKHEVKKTENWDAYARVYGGGEEMDIEGTSAGVALMLVGCVDVLMKETKQSLDSIFDMVRDCLEKEGMVERAESNRNN